MKELDAGHIYKLDTLDGDVEIILRFVKREGAGFPFNRGHFPGTNMQEVLRACIARLKFLSEQSIVLRDAESIADNFLIIINLRDSLYKLEQRAARRHDRKLLLTCEDLQRIELLPTCLVCGHIDPENHKHKESL